MFGATITLSDKHTAVVEDYNGKPSIVVYENDRRTPGQWYAETLAASANRDKLYIDYGAGWFLDGNEAAMLYGFAVGVLKAAGLR